jgi:hypothetical protein
MRSTRIVSCSLVIVTFLSLSSPGLADFAHQGPDKFLKGDTTGGHLQNDVGLMKETVDLGTALFFPTPDTGDFSLRYTEKHFGTGQNLASALHSGNERAVALAAYDMMRPLNDETWSSGYDKVEKIVKQFNDKNPGNSQYEGFAKRLMVAFDNWGENLQSKKPQDSGAPTDPKLVSFYDAFKQVKAEKALEHAEMAKILKSAGGRDGDGSDADKRRLYDDPKFAVGPHVLAWLGQLAKTGDKENLKKWVNALGHSKGDEIVLTGNYQGKPFNLFIKKNDDKALLASINNPLIRNASFVGYEHPDTAKASNWEWRDSQMAVKQNAQDAALAYAGTAGARGTAVGVRKPNQPK